MQWETGVVCDLWAAGRSIAVCLAADCGQCCQQRRGGEGQAGRQAGWLFCAAQKHRSVAAKCAPTVLCTGQLAISGQRAREAQVELSTGPLPCRAEHTPYFIMGRVRDRNEDSSLSLAAWSSTFRRNVVLPF